MVLFLQVQVACAEQFPNEVKEAFITDLLAEDGDERCVVNTSKAVGNIALHEPVGRGPFVAYLPKSRVATAVRSKAVAGFMEVGTIWAFVDAFEHETNNLLHDFIACRGYS